VDWFFPFYWAAAVDPVACGLVLGPPSTPPRRSCSDDLDLDLVLIVYGVLVETCACGICGASLDPATGVRRSRSLFTAARIVVTTRCRGPRRHRHLAKVSEHAGDLRMAPLRPA
jgi:hypothetical protein